MSGAFLASDRVVRLINRDSTGRAPSWWSTVAHRRLEDRVLDHLAVLQQRQVAPLDQTAVTAVLARAHRLGDDQAAAVGMLAGPGTGLRALIAPAGYGKTTALAAGVDAARRAGRPVLAVSTTNQSSVALTLTNETPNRSGQSSERRRSNVMSKAALPSTTASICKAYESGEYWAHHKEIRVLLCPQT